MAAPAYRDSTLATADEETTITGTEPVGAAQDDAFIAVLTWKPDATGVGAITPPANWTLEVRTGASDEAIPEQAMYSIRRGAGAPSFVWSWVEPADCTLTITAYSGADTTTLTEVPAGQENASSTPVTAPSITTTVNDTTLHFAGGIDGLKTFTPPTGMTEREDGGTSGAVGGCAQEGADEAFATAGATGTRVATASVAAANIGQLIAIRPAGGVTPADPTVRDHPTVRSLS